VRGKGGMKERGRRAGRLKETHRVVVRGAHVLDCQLPCFLLSLTPSPPLVIRNRR
jgi:hypothetical protein